jgi:hypothetical protein
MILYIAIGLNDVARALTVLISTPVTSAIPMATNFLSSAKRQNDSHPLLADDLCLKHVVL